MNERDRLAADLRTAANDFADDPAAYLDRGDAYDAMADRLIALGWTRLDEERLAAQMQRRYGWSPTKAWQEAQIIAKAYREDTEER